MLRQRKYFKNFQLILKILFKKKELNMIIYKSFFRNHSINPQIRLSFSINIFFFNKLNYVKSFQKLICPFSLSKKVPSKHFLYSRFFFHKTFNTLNVCNTLK